MIARCPHCHTGHAIRYQLGQPPVHHRCRACGTRFPVFSALEIEVAGRPRIPEALRPPGTEQPPATLRAGRYERLAAPPPLSPPSPMPEFGASPTPAPQPDARVREGLGRLTGLIAGLFLITALVAQVLIHERAHLAAHPELAALTSTMCRQLPCPEPIWRVPAAIRIDLLQWTEPGPGLLQVDVQLTNDLDRAQPWPLLEMALSDRYGRILGQGRWHPTTVLALTGAGPGPEVPLLEAGAVQRLRLIVDFSGPAVEGVTLWPL